MVVEQVVVEQAVVEQAVVEQAVGDLGEEDPKMRSLVSITKLYIYIYKHHHTNPN